jgi:hypothetical protein
MNGPIDGVVAIHNALRSDIALIEVAALESAKGRPGLGATIERFRFLNEVLTWHADGEDAVISPLLESVAPDVYDTYERDHRALDRAFAELNHAVCVGDPLETARVTKAFRFHLELHLDKEDAHLYRLLGERVALPDLGKAVGQMAAHAPKDRFPEVVAWMFPLLGTHDRLSMTHAWQASMPPEGFAMATALIQQAIGDDWTELAVNIPTLVGAR